MARIRTQRGLTLVESMVAMAIMMIGATGMVAMNRQGLQLNADGRRMTRAVTIAQDLLAQIETWPYDDVRLGNGNTANDATYLDGAQKFTEPVVADELVDHREGDLKLGGAAWLGIPEAELAAGQYERFWNVAELDDTNLNGIPDCRRIAVIVRWPQGGGFRRIVLTATKVNNAPEERL